MTYHLHSMASELAREAFEEANGYREEAEDFLHQSCDGHEVAIYYAKAIQFCSEVDTNDGEQYLEDCESLALPGDSFGAIACRIAFATLYCAALETLNELCDENEEA